MSTGGHRCTIGRTEARKAIPSSMHGVHSILGLHEGNEDDSLAMMVEQLHFVVGWAAFGVARDVLANR